MRKKWRVSKYTVIAFAILVIGVITVAAALAVEDRRDEAITAEITRAESDLQELGALAAIKDVDLTSMNVFISAYAQIWPRKMGESGRDFGSQTNAGQFRR